MNTIPKDTNQNEETTTSKEKEIKQSKKRGDQEGNLPNNETKENGDADQTDQETINIKKDVQAFLEKINKNVEYLGGVGIPLGWDEWPPKFKGFSEIIYKTFGLFLSVLAISLGAPLWFDFLKKMLQIRSLVKPKQ